jgi:NADH-quinone oxidoreductase subunit A
MSTEFTPLFLFILIAIFGVAAVMVLLSAVLGPRRETLVKQMPYESGMNPVGDARQRFDVRYYLVAIAFLLFDVELLYLYPWAVGQWSADTPRVVADVNGTEGEGGEVALSAQVGPGVVAPMGVGIPPALRNIVFGEILVFIGVLAAAFAYAWRKGVFEWR